MIQYLRRTVEYLNRDIYTGKRYETNRKGISVVSVVITFAGIIMSVMNVAQRYYDTLMVSLAVIVMGALMFVFAGLLKRRDGAVASAVIGAMAIFGYVAAAGIMQGFAILWTLLVPMIICYFFSVKLGIVVSMFFELLFVTLFYTPLRVSMAAHYSETFMNRFPILYLTSLAVTAIIMAQYHKGVLFQIDHEKMLVSEKEAAEQSSSAKSQFLANMSHEIRTPINAVLGMNEMILRESDDTNVLAYSENIRTAGTTLLGLINDILDFSKIEAGKMEILPVDYDLSSVINDLVNMIRTRAEDKGLLLKLDFNETTPKLLRGDEVRIKQVITNILTNAVKYTEKGSVAFRIGYEKAADDPESVYLDVSVKDTGIGIKPEDLTKLFSKFERIEEKRNRNIEGTGLGMNITKSLLEMMGSRLEVESVYGEGSTFSFRLKQKVVKWDALGDYEASYRASVSGTKKSKGKFTAPDATVLVVDDTPMNLAVFQSLLKRTLAQIDTAASGDEGLALASGKKYDIIFLDHMMPKKDGVETLHELRAQTENPNLQTPTVCLTANAISGAREQYLAAGFDDYLTKPVDADKLEKMLLRYLPQEKLKAPAEAAAPKRAERDLRSEVKRQALRAEHLAREMMLALSKTVDAKDRYTNGHSERVAAYAAEIARRMGKSHAEQERIYEIGLLHDIGKIGVPEELLNKTEHLTASEFEKIKSHTVIGSQILRLITEMPELASGARSHHERYDGKGYPDGLKGAEIPETSRILCLADCYDAMTSTRIYAQPRTQAEVRAELERCAGVQFDPEIAKVLLAMIDEDKDYVMNERTADIHVWQGCDKLWTSAGEEPETEEQPDEEETDEAELPAWLRESAGLDVDAGMKYCGSARMLRGAMELFYRGIESDAEAIETAWHDGDLKNYTIKVHALKSAARTIGAKELSERARAMEEAGNAGDSALIGEKTPELLELYRGYTEKLKPLFESDEEDTRALIDEGTLASTYSAVAECAAMMDYDMTEAALDSLRDYRLPPEDKKRVEEIRTAMMELDWDRVAALCKQ